MDTSGFLRLKAVPLASFRARGTARVVAFFSEENGQIRCAVRGSSKRNQSLPAAVPLFSTYDLLVASPSKGRDLHEVREREVVVQRNQLNQGQPIAAWAAASVLAETLLRGTQEGDPHPYLFKMLDKALTCLENGAPPRLLLLAFLVKYLEHSGYGMRLEATVDGIAIPPHMDVLFDTASCGVFLLPERTQAGRTDDISLTGRCFRLEPVARQTLLKIRLAVFDHLKETAILEAMVRKLTGLAHACLEHHLEIRLKSFDLFEQVMGKEEHST